MSIHALRTQRVGVVDLQNRRLLDNSEQHQNAESRIQIQRFTAPLQAQQTKRNGQRQRQQNDERVNQMFVLRGQHDVHKDKRQNERHAEV